MLNAKRSVSNTSSCAFGYVCVSVEYSLALSLAPLSRTAALEQGCLGVWVYRCHGDREMDDGQEGAYGGRIHAFIRRQRQRMEAPVPEEQSAADGLLCRLSAQVRLKARINNIAAAIVAGYRPCTARVQATSVCGALLEPNGIFESMTVQCAKCGGHVCFGCRSATEAGADEIDLIHAVRISLIYKSILSLFFLVISSTPPPSTRCNR